MWLVWIGAVLIVLKFLEFGPVAAWPWWWILAPLGAAFLWFEGLERLFGRDRRKVEHDELRRLQQQRAEKTFHRPGGRNKNADRGA